MGLFRLDGVMMADGASRRRAGERVVSGQVPDHRARRRAGKTSRLSIGRQTQAKRSRRENALHHLAFLRTWKTLKPSLAAGVPLRCGRLV